MDVFAGEAFSKGVKGIDGDDFARNLMATQGRTAGYRAEVVVLPKVASESLCE